MNEWECLNKKASLSLNRVQTAYTTGPNWGEQYSIDAWGNLFQRTGISGKTNFEPGDCPANGLNQLTTCGFIYDAAGNLTYDGNNTYTYDAENRIIQVNGLAGTWTYVYDGEGERVEKCAGTSCGTTGTIYWRSALDGATLGESDLNVNFQNAYVLVNGKPIGRLDNPSDSAVYYLDDHLGSTSVILDSSANIVSESDYYPYGGEIPIITGDSNHYKFTGKERDSESGLDNFTARYFGSSLGRFMSPDPMGGHPEDPQTLNRYAYVRNNPTTLTDPTGLDFYLRCSGGDTSTCQGGHVGTTDDKGKFTATVVTSDSIREGKNSASVDQNGVEVTTGGKTYSGQYFDNPASHTTDAKGNDVNHNPVDLKGSGQFVGFSFNINGNCSGTCLASGSFSFNAPRDFTGNVLQLRGSFRSIVDRRIPGWGKSLDEWEFHPGTEQYRFGTGPSPHFSLPDNPKDTVPTVGPFHVDKDAPGIQHLGCAKLGVGCQ